MTYTKGDQRVASGHVTDVTGLILRHPVPPVKRAKYAIGQSRPSGKPAVSFLISSLAVLTLLRSHMRHHEKKFACDKCDRRFPDSKDLSRHLISHMDQTEKAEISVKCHYCDTLFTRKDNLDRHEEDVCKVRRQMMNEE
jgi:uncharacterized Zn-finger protein